MVEGLDKLKVDVFGAHSFFGYGDLRRFSTFGQMPALNESIFRSSKLTK